MGIGKEPSTDWTGKFFLVDEAHERLKFIKSLWYDDSNARLAADQPPMERHLRCPRLDKKP